MSVTIRLLGRFAVEIDGAAVDEKAWRLRKARTLVKVLARAGRVFETAGVTPGVVLCRRHPAAKPVQRGSKETAS